MRRTASADCGPAGPAAEARRHRNVLLAAQGKADRAADNAGAGLVRPHFLAGFLVISFELALRRAGKDEVAARGQHTAHEGRWCVDGPLFLTGPRIECNQLAVALVPLDAANAPVWLAFRAISFCALDVGADFPARHEYHFLDRAVAHRVPPLAAFRGWADVLGLVVVSRHFLLVDDRTP